MNKLKKILFSLIMIAGCIAAARLTHRATHGFRLSKIDGNLLTAKPSIENPEVSSLLGQKFYFLSRGLQSFVFLSEDQHTVLKLFNNRYQTKSDLFFYLSHIPGFEKWANGKKRYYQTKLS